MDFPFNILIILLIVGFCLWAFNTFVTFIDTRFKSLINGVVIIFTLIWIILELRRFF